MWVPRHKSFVSWVLAIMAISSLSEPLLCAPLHSGHHQHGASAVGPAQCGQPCSDHAHDGPTQVVPCDCPASHDCDHCDSHHYTAFRNDRPLQGQARLSQPTCLLMAAVMAQGPLRQQTALLPTGPPLNLQKSLSATVLLI